MFRASALLSGTKITVFLKPADGKERASTSSSRVQRLPQTFMPSMHGKQRQQDGSQRVQILCSTILERQTAGKRSIRTGPGPCCSLIYAREIARQYLRNIPTISWVV